MILNCFHTMKAMQNKSEPLYESIKTIDEIGPFAARVVAFKMANPIDYSSLLAQRIDDNVRFAYVSVFLTGIGWGEGGYNLYELKQEDSVNTIIDITNARLKKISLVMRLLTDREKTQISPTQFTAYYIHQKAIEQALK